MKKIIMLIILIMIVISCAELAELERDYQQTVRERGRKCFENYKGEFLGCRYADE